MQFWTLTHTHIYSQHRLSFFYRVDKIVCSFINCVKVKLTINACGRFNLESVLQLVKTEFYLHPLPYLSLQLTTRVHCLVVNNLIILCHSELLINIQFVNYTKKKMSCL